MLFESVNLRRPIAKQLRVIGSVIKVDGFSGAIKIRPADGIDTWIGKAGSGYYFGLFVFGFFSLYFSFGNIENAKTL